MENKKGVKFVRIHGRIVPIRQGSGTKGGPIKAADNNNQKIGKTLQKAGAVAATASLISFLPKVVGSTMFDIEKEFVVGSAKVMNKVPRGSAAYKRLAVDAGKSVNRMMAADKIQKLGKYATPLLVGAVGLSLAGLPFAIAGNRQKTQDARDVLKYRRSKKK